MLKELQVRHSSQNLTTLGLGLVGLGGVRFAVDCDEV